MNQHTPACAHYSNWPERRSPSGHTPNLKNGIKERLADGKAGALAYSVLRRVYRSLRLFAVIHDRYYSNNNLGIFITAVCNQSCFNCQTSARQAPSKDVMSVAQVQALVDEALNLKYYWDRVIITGGEATTHPHFLEVLAALKRYKDFHPGCTFVLETNGVGAKVQSMLEKVPDWITINNSNKTKGEYSYTFASYSVAPVDTPIYRFSDFTKGCSRLDSTYGLCASMYGFFPCSPCMNVARVFGFDIGIQRLATVDENTMREQMKILCRYCGWFKERPEEVIRTEKVSRSWKRAFAEYKRQPPKLTFYE